MDGGMGDIVEILHGLQSKDELNKLRSRIRDALHGRVAKGYWAGLAPYGYKRIPDGDYKRLVIDEKTAPVVLRIYSEYDFYDDSTSNSMKFRVRHFYGQAWNFLIGQTYTAFMDIDAFPDVIDYQGPNGIVNKRQP